MSRGLGDVYKRQHLQTVTVSFPTFQFGCLLFLFLVWSLWLDLPIPFWIEVVKVDALFLWLILEGKFLVFFFEYDVGSRVLVCGLYYVEVSPSVPTLLSVSIINGCCTLSNAFSTSIDMIMWFLSLLLFLWCIMFIDLWILYHPGMNPSWSWCVIFLMYC